MGDSTAMTSTVEDVLGDFGFRLRWSANHYHADVEAFEIAGRLADGNTPQFHRKGWTDGMDVVPEIDEAEPYLAGFVKWDGCTELDQGCPHWCGAPCFGKHIDLLAYIWRRAHELMGREPDGYDLRATTIIAPASKTASDPRRG